MKARGVCLLCVLLSAAVVGAAADAPPADASDAERLVQRLGSPRFAEREAAFKALDALGAVALPALRNAAKSKDAEVRQRAGELLGKLERAADAAEAFAPTKVHLKAVDVPLADVVRDLTLQSRVRLQLAREPVDLPGRRVSVDTGEVSFWESLEALCRQAKVSIRPGAFEPDPAVGRAINLLRGPVPSLQGTEETLVLQDGILPPCPTAYVGGVRLRLIPDRWGNRNRGPGEELQWMLEVSSEPRVHWQAAPAITFEKTAGLTVTCASISQTSGYRGVMFGPSPVGADGRPPPRGITQYHLPVTLKAEPQAARTVIPELHGTLATTVQLGTQLAVTVDDVEKANAKGSDAHGAKVSIGNCQVNADGSAAIQADVERPSTGSGGGSFRTAGAGIPLASAAPMLTSLGRDGESLRLIDAQDRPYSITVRVTAAAQQGGTTTVNYVLDCKPAAPDAKPKKLELHCPRRAPVEAKFVLREVPVP
ncbi:MAG TPA: hypothetical protein VL371_07070 [Gemmataceae bacterium]|jgi:hypothetical protein|nr:hypothetical protein [Gemmataceae bacterium]